jgi:ubiquinone/menaquinone biosynthesis C-methylase UbiE
MSELPDFYVTVSEEILCRCQPAEGVWVDLGAGPGGVGLALARQTNSTIVMIDPDENALQKALSEARNRKLGNRVVAVKGWAEAIPLPDNSVDLVVSRGSIFFWKDKPKGISEVYRILRPGGAAMIGGGLGKSYPQWARQEFARRRHEGVKNKGEEAYKGFKEARSPQTFRRIAQEAGLVSFEVDGNGGAAADSPQAGSGIWLLFRKGNGKI